MAQREPRRVQEHALQAEPAKLAIEREVAVFLVPQDRMAKVGQVHADLVRPAGEKLCLEQAEALAAAQAAQHRLGGLAVLRDRDVLALPRAALREREPYTLALVAKAPGHSRQVALVHVAIAQHAMQLRQRGAPLRDEQHARRLAVEAMDEFQEACFGTHRAQRFDDAVRDAAAAMHGEPRGLVDREQRLVLEEDGQRKARRRRGRLASGHAYRRNADAIAGGDPVARLHTLAVDTHLAASQDAVDPALGNALEPGGKIVVDALPGL